MPVFVHPILKTRVGGPPLRGILDFVQASSGTNVWVTGRHPDNAALDRRWNGAVWEVHDLTPFPTTVFAGESDTLWAYRRTDPDTGLSHVSGGINSVDWTDALTATGQLVGRTPATLRCFLGWDTSSPGMLSWRNYLGGGSWSTLQSTTLGTTAYHLFPGASTETPDGTVYLHVFFQHIPPDPALDYDALVQWAAGSASEVLHLTGVYGGLRDIWAGDDTHVYALYRLAGNATGLLVGHDTTWAPFAEPSRSDNPTWAAVHGTSPTDLWLVGYGDDSTGDPWLGLLAHWNGTTWTVTEIGSPTVPDSGIYFWDVFALAPDNVWTASNDLDATFHALVVPYHWDGTAWVARPVTS